MANTLTNGVYQINATGVLKQSTNTDPALGVVKVDTDPIHVKAILVSGTGGSVTFKDNQSTPASEFTVSATASLSVSLPFGEHGHVFPKGLQVTAIDAGCTVTIFLY